jgi:hypothetical protein
MFTKKHYVKIAEVLEIEYDKAINKDKALKADGVYSNTTDGVKSIIHELKNLFKRDNINFNSEKFFEACFIGKR